jgi:hypothetical protein
MNPKVLCRSFAAGLLFAALAYPQAETKTSEANQGTAPNAATAEAKRQGRVAMKPNSESPAQSLRQAIAFERYKELAAQREARKQGTASTSTEADRSMEKAQPEKAQPMKEK